MALQVPGTSFLGSAVARDAGTLLVGSPGNSSVYVFSHDGIGWTLVQTLAASDTFIGDGFGNSISLSGDRVAIAAYDSSAPSHAVYVFERQGGLWTEIWKLQPSSPWVGAVKGLGLSLDGTTLAVGDAGFDAARGIVRIFTQSGSSWPETESFSAPGGDPGDHFAAAVSLRGDRLVAGAPGDDDAALDAGALYVLARSGSWLLDQKLLAPDATANAELGYSTSVIDEGNVLGGAPQATVGGLAAGAGYLFSRDNLVWSLATRLEPSPPQASGFFGFSCASDSGRVLIGERGPSGAAHLFDTNGMGWALTERVVSGSSVVDSFGHDVALSNGALIVGAPLAPDGIFVGAGAAHVFGCADVDPPPPFFDIRLFEPPSASLPPAAPLECTGVDLTIGSVKEGVHLFSGEYFRSSVDLALPGRGLDFGWMFTYRSRISPTTNRGLGIVSSYDVRLRFHESSIILSDGSGREDQFVSRGDGTYLATGLFRLLERQSDGTYVLTFENTGSWSFLPLDGPTPNYLRGRLSVITDRNGNQVSLGYDGLIGNLNTITDSLGKVTTLSYGPLGRLSGISDCAGRTTHYDYFGAGDPDGPDGALRSITTPSVTSTPNGNDFPQGKSTRFTYTQGFADADLNGDLVSVTNPRGQLYLTNVYAHTIDAGDSRYTLDPNDIHYDRIVRQIIGNPGDIIDWEYVVVTPGSDNNDATLLCVENDRMGNVREVYFDALNREVLRREYTGRAADPRAPTTLTVNRPGAPLRPDDPPYFETRTDYNDDSQPTKIVHPKHNETLFVYESDWDPMAEPRARGNLRQRIERPGPTGGDQVELLWQYDYDTAFGGCCGTNFVIREVDPNGNETLHEYDALGNRTRTRHPISTVIEDWEYNAFGQKTAHIHPPVNDSQGARRRDAYTYGSSGDANGYLIASIVDATNLALTTTYERDCAGNVTRSIDPRGHDTLYTVNQLNQIVEELSREVTDGSGIRYRRTYEYDASDNLVAIEVENRDENGQLRANSSIRTQFTYTSLNQPFLVTRELGPTEFLITVFDYDANQNRRLVIYGEALNGPQLDNQVATIFDERDLPFQEIRGFEGTEPSTTQFDYDENGILKAQHHGLEAGPHVTRYVNDGFDRLRTETDAMGNVTERHYDPNGNLISEEVFGALSSDEPGSTGDVRLTEQLRSYDAMDRLVARAESYFDPGSGNVLGPPAVRTLAYDDASNLVAETSSRGFTTSRSYDTAHRLAEVTDPKGNRTIHTYDSGSNRTATRTVEKSDQGGPSQEFLTTYAYDNLDRRVSTIDSAGNVATVAYDSRSNPVLSVDGRGHETRSFFDDQDRLVAKVEDMNGNGASLEDESDIVVRQTWDQSSRLVERIDDNGNVTRTQYDGLSRIVGLTVADGTTRVFQRDAHDNVVREVDGNGTVIDSVFDDRDRVLARIIAPGPGVAPDTTFESFAYDGLSRLTRAEDDDSIVTRSYDSLGHLTQETQNGRVLQYTKDSAGNTTRLVYPTNQIANTTYDELERKKTVSRLAELVATFSYVGADRVESIAFGNGTSSHYTYDGIQGVPNEVGDHGVKKIVRIRHAGPGDATLDERSYRWDEVGNKILMRDERTGARRSHRYDSANRLIETRRRRAGGLLSASRYSLDGVHNRLTIAPPQNGLGRPGAGSSIVYTMDPVGSDRSMNQYTTTPFDQRTYDANGNLLTVTWPSGSVASAIYDHRNLMVAWSDPVRSHQATYRYDALGRRIEKSVTAAGVPKSTQYVYDGWQVIEETPSEGNHKAYLYGNGIDEVLWTRQLPLISYYAADDLGSTVLTTDRFGAVQERHDYDDYGRPSYFSPGEQPRGSSGVGTEHLFTGRRFDAESGLYYYRTRYLDPLVGRFTSRDSIGIWGDRGNRGNAATYVGDRPGVLTDPDGRLPLYWWAFLAFSCAMKADPTGEGCEGGVGCGEMFCKWGECMATYGTPFGLVPLFNDVFGTNLPTSFGCEGGSIGAARSQVGGSAVGRGESLRVWGSSCPGDRAGVSSVGQLLNATRGDSSNAWQVTPQRPKSPTQAMGSIRMLTSKREVATGGTGVGPAGPPVRQLNDDGRQISGKANNGGG